MARDPWMAKAALQGKIPEGFFHQFVARSRKRESRKDVLRWLVRFYRREIWRVAHYPSRMYEGATEEQIKRNQRRTLARYQQRLNEWENELRRA